MEKASSSQQTAQSETPTYFTREELSKLKSDFQTGSMEKVKVQPLLKKEVKELDNTELNIAVTGESGAGKSTFINAMRGLCSEDEGAAAVGNEETTKKPTGYAHPYLPNVRYWDLPGTGSPQFTAGSYLKEMQFEKYDFFIIVAAARFTDNEAKLATEIKRLGKKFYYVRSKIDADLYSMRLQRKKFDEDAEMETIRSYCVSGLGKAGIPDPNVFLISSFKGCLYDFPRLIDALEDGLPNIKKSVFVLGLPNNSVKIIEKKAEVLKKRTLLWRTIAEREACNTGEVIEMIIDFRKYLCLDDAGLRRLAGRTGKSVEELHAAAQSPLLGKITTKVIGRLGPGAVRVAVSAFNYVPDIGPHIEAVIPSSNIYMILCKALDLLLWAAKKVFAFVTSI